MFVQKVLPLVDAEINMKEASDNQFIVSLACKNALKDHTFEVNENASAFVQLLRNAALTQPLAPSVDHVFLSVIDCPVDDYIGRNAESMDGLCSTTIGVGCT